MSQKCFTLILLAALSISVSGIADERDAAKITLGGYLAGPKWTDADLKGKVLLIHEWRHICPTCRRSLPIMQKVWEKYKDRGLVLISSHVIPKNMPVINKLVEDNKITYHVCEVAKYPGEKESFVPNLHLFTPDGKCVWIGDPFKAELDEQIEKALKTLTHPILGTYPYAYAEKDIEQILAGKNYEQILEKLTERAKNNDEKAGKLAENVNKFIIEQIDQLQKNTASNPGLAFVMGEHLTRMFGRSARVDTIKKVIADVKNNTENKTELNAARAFVKLNEIRRKIANADEKTAVALQKKYDGMVKNFEKKFAETKVFRSRQAIMEYLACFGSEVLRSV